MTVIDGVIQKEALERVVPENLVLGVFFPPKIMKFRKVPLCESFLTS